MRESFNALTRLFLDSCAASSLARRRSFRNQGQSSLLFLQNHEHHPRTSSKNSGRCAKKSKELGLNMNVAVVNEGVNLVAFAHMDGAWLGSIDISIKKAKTAKFFNMLTGALGGLSQPGGPLFNIEVSNGGLITFPGGIPIKGSDGEVIGAIGVSGSTVENDQTVAQAGVDALA